MSQKPNPDIWVNDFTPQITGWPEILKRIAESRRATCSFFFREAPAQLGAKRLERGRTNLPLGRRVCRKPLRLARVIDTEQLIVHDRSHLICDNQRRQVVSQSTNHLCAQLSNIPFGECSHIPVY